MADLINDRAIIISGDEDIGLDTTEANSTITNDDTALHRIAGKGCTELW